jgi:SecD/SecF fusion protein
MLKKNYALFKTEDGKNSSVEAKTFGSNNQLKIYRLPY